MDAVQTLEAKLERAEQHIDEVDAAVEAFLKSNPYEVRVDEQPELSKRIYRLVRVDDVPVAVSVLAGEVLYQLRSTLDHTIWRLVLAAGNTPTSATSFPIADNATKYKSLIDSGKVDGIPDAAKKRIDAIKPYGGGNEDLWLLGKLNNIDKHRLLLTVGSYNTARTTTTAEDHARLKRDYIPTDVAEAIERGDTLLARFRSTPRSALKQGHILFIERNPEPDKHMGFEFNVSFSEPKIIRVEPPGLTLRRIWNAVSWAVSDLAVYL